MTDKILKKWALRFVPISIIAITAVSCAIIYNKREMYLADEPFYSDSVSFRIDGYYYTVEDFAVGESHLYENGKRVESKACAIQPILFFEDGTARVCWISYGTKAYSSESEKKENIRIALQDFEKSLMGGSYHGQPIDKPWDWGFYKQSEGDSLVIQTYLNSIGDYVLLDWLGKVENDTTLFIHYWINNNQYIDSKHYKKELNKVYHFKEFHHKPDSTNYILENIEKFGKRRKIREVH